MGRQIDHLPHAAPRGGHRGTAAARQDRGGHGGHQEDEHRPPHPHHGRGGKHRIGDGAPGGHLQALGADTGRSGRDAYARRAPLHDEPPQGPEGVVHRRLHHQRVADGADLCRPQAGVCLPRRGLQARADDGGQPRHGHTEQRLRHTRHRRPGRQIPDAQVCDDLHRQGRQSHQRHGLQQAHLRDLLPVAQQSHPGRRGKGRDAVCHHPLRQRARLQRIGHPALQRADQEGRPRHRHPQGHHPLLHAHPRGLPPGAGGWHDGPRRRDLRLRHGRSCPHRRPGSAHDRTLGSQKRQDRIHGSARRRETLRGSAQRRGADQADRPPEDQGGCRPRILLQAGAQERNGPLRPLPAV